MICAQFNKQYSQDLTFKKVKVETESPLRKMTSWIGRKTYSIFGYGEEEKSTRNLVSGADKRSFLCLQDVDISAAAETIQASPPTRLASTGKEEDEVKLIKVRF